MRRLQRDPEIVRHDPAAEEGVRERFEAWQAAEVDTLEAGVEGAEWRARIEALLEDPADGPALKQLEQTLGALAALQNRELYTNVALSARRDDCVRILVTVLFPDTPDPCGRRKTQGAYPK